MKLLVNGDNLKSPAKPGDAGYDLICDEDTYLMFGVPTYIAAHAACKLPEGHWGLILPRSSTGKKGILIIPSVIDEGYTGPLYTYALAASGSVDVKKGERIAQMVILPLITPPIVRTTEPLPRTDRGESGFGSTDNPNGRETSN